MQKLQRVQKILSNYGYCSRRKAEKLIEDGKVRINDTIISLGDKVTEKDKIYVNNKLVEKEKEVYIMFNKPPDCVTALTDKHYKTVMNYINIKERIFPVGRLDYNTSGLLILTNDGNFANNIMHPRYEIKKTYSVLLDKPIDKNQILKIEKGVNLEDGKTRPVKIKKIKENLVEIKIHEGKNRIVKRIFNHLGFKVKKLERKKIGLLSLGNLKEGKTKKLTEEDKKLIFKFFK